MKIPLNVCTYDEEEIQAATDVLRSTNVTMGEQCLAFETEFAKKMGVKEAVFVNSGSSANLLTWFAFANPQFNSLPKDWEVIVPAVGWATTYWPIIQAGGKPVIVDCNLETLQMDTEAMKRALTPRTVAVCPVHVLGNAVDMTQVNKFAKEHDDLIVMEDTCEALGTKFNNRFAGTLGDVGTFSFFFSHHITSIEGGMIVTNRGDFADVLRMMRSHGWSRASAERKEYEALAPSIDPRFFFATTGFNLRPTEINAAIGRIQLRKLDQFNQRRNEIARLWNDRFKNSHFFKPMQITPGTDPAWFGYPVICTDVTTRKDLKVHLETAGIETRPIVSGNIRRHPAMAWLSHSVSGTLEGADAATDRGLLWGLHPKLTDEEVGYVMGVVEAFRV